MVKKKEKDVGEQDALSPAARVRESKRKVHELEQRNYGSVIMWKCNDKWWKMCDNSALIYYFHVAPMIERKPIIHMDTDRFFNSMVGTISINVEAMPGLEEVMAAHDIRKSQHSDDTIISFVLPERLDKDEIESFRLRLQGERDRINEILRGKNLYPFFSTELRKTVSTLFSMTKKMDRDKREFVGQRMLNDSVDLYLILGRMERDEIQLKDGAEKMQNSIDDMMACANILLELRLIDIPKLEGLVKHLHNMRTECVTMLKDAAEKGRK